MAIGHDTKTDDNSSPSTSNNGQQFGEKGYFQPDTEAQQPSGPRKMSRIDRPVTNSISGVAEGRKPSVDPTGSGEDITVGAQMEMEAGNAIQYRTCSWQKV